MTIVMNKRDVTEGAMNLLHLQKSSFAPVAKHDKGMDSSQMFKVLLFWEGDSFKDEIPLETNICED